jgi:hypothetical protein
VSEWLQRAACRGKPIGWWYPGTADTFTASVAVMVCRRCPVRSECLDAALAEETAAEGYVFGIRAGLGARQRIQLRRRVRLGNAGAGQRST